MITNVESFYDIVRERIAGHIQNIMVIMHEEKCSDRESAGRQQMTRLQDICVCQNLDPLWILFAENLTNSYNKQLSQYALKAILKVYTMIIY